MFYLEQGNFDANNLIADADDANQLLNVDDLTSDFGQSVPANASTSGDAAQFAQNLAIAKYNKTTSNDDIMRIAST